MKNMSVFLFGKMNGFWGTVKVAGGAILVFMISALGGWDMTLKVLVAFTALDIITGLLSALYLGKASSAIGYKGLIRKVCIYCMVAVSQLLDSYAGVNFLRTGLIGFYIAMEGLSVLENIGKTGLPMFPVVKNALEQLKTKSEETKDGNKNSEEKEESEK